MCVCVCLCVTSRKHGADIASASGCRRQQAPRQNNEDSTTTRRRVSTSFVVAPRSEEISRRLRGRRGIQNLQHGGPPNIHPQRTSLSRSSVFARRPPNKHIARERHSKNTMMSHHQQQQYQQQYILQQEQQRREEIERQLYYASASLEDMRRQLVDLQSAYQQQGAMLDHERQRRVELAEQVKQQQAMLVEKERRQVQREEKQRVSEEQRQLIERVSAEVRRFQAANDGNAVGATGDEGCLDSEFTREMAFIPSSEIPAPNKYPRVDWTADYSMARLQDMMEEPESSRNELFYVLLGFHAKRLEALRVDNECADELIKRVNEELFSKSQS